MTQTSMTTDVRTLLSWEAAVTPELERSARWYAVFGLCVGAGMLYGIISGAWSVALVSPLLGLVYALQHGSKPQRSPLSITTDGIFARDGFTRYDECMDFAITGPIGSRMVRIRRKNPAAGTITAQLHEIDPDRLRHALARFLPERKNARERWIDTIIRTCKL